MMDIKLLKCVFNLTKLYYVIIYVNQNRSRRRHKCTRRHTKFNAMKKVVDTISPLFDSNCKAPTTLMELSDRDYNRMKENCINVSGITITKYIVGDRNTTDIDTILFHTIVISI